MVSASRIKVICDASTTYALLTRTNYGKPASEVRARRVVLRRLLAAWYVLLPCWLIVCGHSLYTVGYRVVDLARLYKQSRRAAWLRDL